MNRCTLALVLLSLVIPAVTNADVFVPDGLNVGDTYQLAFVTRDIRDATSPDIADYNTFVRDQAELTGAFTKGWGIEWNAIASTATVNASDNAPATAPVYLLDSTLISDAARPLYGGTLWSPFDTDQFRNSASSLAWTGSDSAGQSSPGISLGDTDVTFGSPNVVHEGWLAVGNRPSSTEYAFYALSEELTVVPEPSTLAMFSLFGMIGGFIAWRKRKRT